MQTQGGRSSWIPWILWGLPVAVGIVAIVLLVT